MDTELTNETTAAVWTQGTQLVPWNKNPRKNNHAVDKVAKSIIALGWGAPIVAWQGRVVAGHTRLKASHLIKRLWKQANDKSGWHPDAIRVATTGDVPVRHRDDLTEQQANIMALADNKLGELAEWDEPALQAILDGMADEDRILAGWNEQEAIDVPSEPDSASVLGAFTYMVIVECTNEDHQVEVLNRLEGEGLKCRPSIL